jgi:hypothetical protein
MVESGTNTMLRSAVSGARHRRGRSADSAELRPWWCLPAPQQALKKNMKT